MKSIMKFVRQKMRGMAVIINNTFSMYYQNTDIKMIRKINFNRYDIFININTMNIYQVIIIGNPIDY